MSPDILIKAPRKILQYFISDLLLQFLNLQIISPWHNYFYFNARKTFQSMFHPLICSKAANHTFQNFIYFSFLIPNFSCISRLSLYRSEINIFELLLSAWELSIHRSFFTVFSKDKSWSSIEARNWQLGQSEVTLSRRYSSTYEEI